jgi:hypothetical protein
VDRTRVIEPDHRVLVVDAVGFGRLRVMGIEGRDCPVRRAPGESLQVNAGIWRMMFSR